MAAVDQRTTSIRHWLGTDLRRIAAASTAGLLAGFVVNGIGSRLAMMLLAGLNPQVSGQVSDDGFIMGRFDLGASIGLVLIGTIVGTVGGLIFLLLRDLRFGQPWFRITSMTVGPAVVVAALLVHQGGIDFTVLRPLWLTVGLFVVLPGLYALAVAALADRWLAAGSWFMTAPRLPLLGLLPLLLIAPAAPLFAVPVVVRVAQRSSPRVSGALAAPWLPVAARAVLTALFIAALIDLARDVAALA